MKVLIDRHIPYLQGLLEPYCEVQYVDQEDFTPEAVHDADALLIRTRTRCNEALLKGSKVQFIATATIGFDQIDTAYCEANGIKWTNAPGCNAQGVCDYIESALNYLGFRDNLNAPTLGIVGCGHVGSLVAEMAERKGWNVLVCDPPLEEQVKSRGGAGEKLRSVINLDTLAEQSDVITFHTPLTREGRFSTWHLASYEPVDGQTTGFFRHVRPTTFLINAARGGVIDEKALLKAGNPYILDCWEGEPHLNPEVLRRAKLGTYHIAGYTQAGKYNASQMVLDALCNHFSLPKMVLPNRPAEAPHVWDIEAVSNELKAHPELFEQLRTNYKLR